MAGRDLVIQQSPSLLSSDREEGTTGAGWFQLLLTPAIIFRLQEYCWLLVVVWKIAPLIANWVAADDNFLFKNSIIHSNSTVLELGCGISGLVGLALSPKIRRYLATDQDYVFKTLKLNLEENLPKLKSPKTGQRRKGESASELSAKLSSTNINIVHLDWETSLISPALLNSSFRGVKFPQDTSLDLILACDCTFNEALIDPFVRTCADLCRLPKPESSPRSFCIIAQQLRSHLVFEAWLFAFHQKFRVWRVPDERLHEGMRGGSGFVIHIGLLRDPVDSYIWFWQTSCRLSPGSFTLSSTRVNYGDKNMLMSMVNDSISFMLIHSLWPDGDSAWYPSTRSRLAVWGCGGPTYAYVLQWLLSPSGSNGYDTKLSFLSTIPFRYAICVYTMILSLTLFVFLLYDNLIIRPDAYSYVAGHLSKSATWMNISHIQSPKLYSIHLSELLSLFVIRSFDLIYDHMPIQIS